MEAAAPVCPNPLLTAAEDADDDAVGGADVRDVTKPRRRGISASHMGVVGWVGPGTDIPRIATAASCAPSASMPGVICM